MANELAKITDVSASLAEWSGDFRSVMSSDIDPDKFIAAVTTALTMNPDIVTKCTADSIKNACIKAAYDGLRPDGKEGALVAYGSVAQWMPMVYGIRKKARKHDEIIITADVVYERDKFFVLKGDEDRIEHEPAPPDIDPGKVIASYAIFRRGDEILHREVLRLSDIESVRRASKSPNSPAWNNWFGEMAKKAAVNRGAKSVPMSDAVRQTIDRDNDHYDLSKDVTPAPSYAGRYKQLDGAGGFNQDNVRQLDGNSQQPLQQDRQREPVPSSANTQTSSTAGGDAGSGASQSSPVARLTAEVFENYASALARVSSAESLEKADRKFWEGKGQVSDDDNAVLNKIFNTHKSRVEGSISPDDARSDVAAAIAEATKL